MPCVIANCETNQQTMKKNNKDGIRFIQFPTTDYANDKLRRLAKKRLYWWCLMCGVDFTTTLINQLHICSRHFFKGNCAPLWDEHNPDWIPSLYISHDLHRTPMLSSVQDCNEFIRNEQLTEESIANPLMDQDPDHATLRTLLVDEIIAYSIGRTYFLLDEENGKPSTMIYDAKCLSKELKKCLTPTSAVGKMVLETNAPHCPEGMFCHNSNVTEMDLSEEPRWETEKIIMSLQHSVLNLINLMDTDGQNAH
ncbi:uncharacterized protein LOC128723983 [Anopheles nili]|uniref:uncharacterized protein LOC128723983 n=1 Tax=Anopheles nili TaxID=185578 RepID=UPI00237A850D|nr:uncharacterized protein LOC128723983 [Anopheles nili]